MVYAEEHHSVESAIARERQFKRWTNKKKEALVLGDRRALRALGRRSTKSSAHDRENLIRRYVRSR